MNKRRLYREHGRPIGLLLLCLCLILSGCGTSQSAATTAPSAAATEEPTATATATAAPTAEPATVYVTISDAGSLVVAQQPVAVTDEDGDGKGQN